MTFTIEKFEGHLCPVGGLLPCAVPLCSRGVAGLYFERVELPGGNRTKYRRVIEDGQFLWERMPDESKMNAHQRMVEARQHGKPD